MFKKLVITSILLLSISSVNAALVVFDNRDQWRQQAGGASSQGDLMENFNAVTSDLFFFNSPNPSVNGSAAVGFLEFSVTNGDGDNRWRIDAPNAAFLKTPAIDNSTFAILLSQNSPSEDIGDTRIDFSSPVRAIGFDYIVGTNTTKEATLTSDRADDPAVEIGKSHSELLFLGLLYTEGESINHLDFFSSDKFAMSTDNYEAYSAAAFNKSQDALGLKPPNPVPLPGAVWLFASALLGLAGYGRRKTAISA